jgi:hypothetical protein
MKTWTPDNSLTRVGGWGAKVEAAVAADRSLGPGRVRGEELAGLCWLRMTDSVLVDGDTLRYARRTLEVRSEPEVGQQQSPWVSTPCCH